MNSFGLMAMDKIQNLSQFKRHHKNLVFAIIQLEKKNEYKKLHPIEGRFSQNKIWERDLMEALSLNAYADDMEVCFFGGWPSYREGRFCRVPWNYSMAGRFGRSYDRDHYCRNDNMFRCNPDLFGHGDGSVQNELNGAGLSSGACIDFNANGNSIQDVTRLCYERTQDNVDEMFERYQSDTEFRERYHQLTDEITGFCQRHQNYGACEYLLSRIESMTLKICEARAVEELEVGGEAVTTLTEAETNITAEMIELDMLEGETSGEGMPENMFLIPGVTIVGQQQPSAPEETAEVGAEVEEVVAINPSEEEIVTTVLPDPPTQPSLTLSTRSVAQPEPEVEAETPNISPLAPGTSLIPRQRPERPERDVALVAGDGEVDISGLRNIRLNLSNPVVRNGFTLHDNERNFFDPQYENSAAFDYSGGCETNLSCPTGTSLVCSDDYHTKVCMDTNLRMMDDGVTPRGGMTHNQCRDYCESRNMRLPTNNEWLVGALGTNPELCLPESITYPPLFNTDAGRQSAEGLTQIRRYGRQDRSQCQSVFGLNDMVGVLGQHVTHGQARPNRIQFNGGLYPMSHSSIVYRTTAHGPTYSDYSIGCRCATEAQSGPAAETVTPEVTATGEAEATQGDIDPTSLAVTAETETAEVVDTTSPLAPSRSLIPPQRPNNLEVLGRDEAPAAMTVEGVRAACQVEGTSERWRRNCEQLYTTGIPAGALNYALEVMRLNATSFRTDQCFRPNPRGDNGGLKHAEHVSMDGLTDDQFENNLMANGLPNKCQIVINDTGDRIAECRARMYYIDLCQGSSPVVRETYSNLGTGTCRLGRGYENGVGRRTTVLGAFFTHRETFDFRNTTTQRDAYDRVAGEVQAAGGPRQATAIQLFGLQNTNNLASRTGKYMHVSPWVSSWGCPSIAPENYYMIEALADNGPSLVLNYHEGQMEDINRCTE